jgi:hypothetical protein
MGYGLNRERRAKVVVYALNIRSLGLAWAKLSGRFISDKYENFLYEREGLFQEEYPANTLKYITFPASWNHRMQRQMGVFVFDTLNYWSLGKIDFENFIEDLSESPEPDGIASPILTKIFIPQSVAGHVFQRLELMGITGVRLMDDHVGAAADVYNSYMYGRRTGLTWDIRMLPRQFTR